MRNQPAGLSAMMAAFGQYRFDRARLRECRFPVFLGYGDLTAGTSTGRVLVTFEALIGQIFLVTLVARLVSMYGTRQRPARDGPDDPDDSDVEE